MTRFSVRVLEFTQLEEIAGSWTASDFSRLLGRMEIDDTAGLSSSDLREMCVLSLQDREPRAAAALLLEDRLGDALNKGQIQNISLEMLDEKLWEEYADMPLHERFFYAASLLHQAFPSVVPQPDAVDVRLEVRSLDPDAQSILAEPLHESFVVRLLADGMQDSSSLKRLFGDALAGRAFPEAASIAWIVESERIDAATLGLRVIGSGSWLDSLRGTKSYESSAQADPARRT